MCGVLPFFEVRLASAKEGRRKKGITVKLDENSVATSWTLAGGNDRAREMRTEGYENKTLIPGILSDPTLTPDRARKIFV